MSNQQFTPYDHEQMFAEVKVAYRLSELGGLLEPDSYDSSELEEIDAEYDQWLMKIKADAWDEGYTTGSEDSAVWEDVKNGYRDSYEDTPNPYRDN